MTTQKQNISPPEQKSLQSMNVFTCDTAAKAFSCGPKSLFSHRPPSRWQNTLNGKEGGLFWLFFSFGLLIHERYIFVKLPLIKVYELSKNSLVMPAAANNSWLTFSFDAFHPPRHFCMPANNRMHKSYSVVVCTKNRVKNPELQMQNTVHRQKWMLECVFICAVSILIYN